MSASVQLARMLEDGVPVEEASDLLGLDRSVARLAAAAESEQTFSDDDLADALQGIANIARSGEHERNRLTAAIFVVEVKKGLKVPKREDRSHNITLIQQLIQNANADCNDFARSISARDGRGSGPAVEEPRAVGKSIEPPAAPVLAGTRLQPEPDRAGRDSVSTRESNIATAEEARPDPQAPARV